MKQFRHELTLKNVLTDPMVQIAMAADRVDPQELAAMLASVAQTLQRSPARLSGCIAQLTCPN